jgi:hypothetical protein
MPENLSYGSIGYIQMVAAALAESANATKHARIART